MKFPRSAASIGVAAGLLGGAGGLALAATIFPSTAMFLPASHDAGDAVDAPDGAVPDGTHLVRAADAGTVTYEVAAGLLRLVDVGAADGWTVEVEEDAGREIEVDFRSGTRRVQVSIEIEDGDVRERVRIRDEADGSETTIVNGTVVEQQLGDDDADEADEADEADDQDADEPDEADELDDDADDAADDDLDDDADEPDDDADNDEADNDDDDNSGPSANSGPGSLDDDDGDDHHDADGDDGDDDNSGPGSDSSGPGSGD